MRSSLGKDIGWATGWACWFAVGLSGLVLIVSLLRGSLQWPEYGTTTWGILVAYWLAALGGGVVVGLLRPFVRFRLGAFLVGWIAGTLAYGAVAVAAGLFEKGELWLAAIPGLLVGGGLAVVWFDEG